MRRSYIAIFAAVLACLVYALLSLLLGCAHGVNPWLTTQRELLAMQETAIERCAKSTDPIAQAQYQFCERTALAAQKRANVLVRMQADFDKAKRDGVILTELRVLLEGALKSAIYARDTAYHHCEAVEILRPQIGPLDLAAPDAGHDGGLADLPVSKPDMGAHDASHRG